MGRAFGTYGEETVNVDGCHVRRNYLVDKIKETDDRKRLMVAIRRKASSARLIHSFVARNFGSALNEY